MNDRVALIAVQALTIEGGLPAEFHVVAIGTRSDKPDEWRYARLPLRTFIDRHRANEAIFEDRSEAGTPDIAKPSAQDELGPLSQPGRQVFSNVVLTALYAFDQDLDEEDVPQPLMRLTTAGFAQLPDGAFDAGVHNGGAWVVSTLYILPDVKPGVVKSFELRAHVPFALNGHYVAATDKAGDRFDSRLILRLFAEQKKVPRSLWSTAAGAVPPLAPEGGSEAVFDELSLAITSRSFSSGDTRPAVSMMNARLSDLGIRPDRKRDLSVIPLWADRGLRQPPAAIPVTRSWGFRVAEYREKSKIPRRLVLRLECRYDPSPGPKDDSFERAVKTLLTGVSPDPGGVSGSLKIPIFSQEQRLLDISGVLAPGRPVRWIVAARMEAATSGTSLARALLVGLAKAEEEVEGAMRRVADGSQISALPRLSDFTPASADMPWHILGLLREDRPWRRLIRARTDKVAADRGWRHVTWNVVEPRMQDDYWNPPAAAGENLRVAAAAQFRGIMSTSATPLGATGIAISAPMRASFDAAETRQCVRWPAFQPAVTERDEFLDVDAGVRVGLRIADMPANGDVAIGAFRLAVGSAGGLPPMETDDQMCLIRPYGASGSRLTFGVELALKLPVQSLMPEGQDPPAGSSRAATRDVTRQLLADEVRPDPDDPLLFPKIGRAVSLYELVVRETAGRGRDHEVRLSLRSLNDDQTKAAEGMVVVVDPKPFRIIGVRYAEPRAAVSDLANEVAVWNAGGEGGLSWRVRDDEQQVDLLLPPQVLGEAMEKNRADDATRPPDIAPDRPAAVRFGSPTVLSVDPTFADTGYREPGWNLRRILGFPGQRSPGARLRHLRAELVYGITTRLVPQADIWVAEVGASLGVPPHKLADVAAPDELRGRHIAVVNAVLEAERHRLAVEKLWTEAPDRPLRIERGLTFGLRHRRQYPDGSLSEGGPATPFRWPVPGDIPSDLPLSPAQRALIDGTFSVSPDDRQSFPGGVPWAFESANILGEVYREPVSESGRIQDVHLSALGAWAGQRALFAQDKSIIDTEVTMGRLQRYKLERIGRIGGLWNRAKHVIVYERTVVPPRQFYNLHPIGVQQDAHLGRPVLRKVEEYVELLQPVRRYPENGTSLSAAGFLLGAEFKSRRIAVDSRWGGDVRREGWAVPLWNPAFDARPGTTSQGSADNPDDPSLIYPKPQIRCLFAAADGGETAVEIDDPQKLVFYTSTLGGERGDDTDAWRPVREVDFVDLPLPVAGKLQPRSDQLSDAMLPPEPAHAPGYEKLTLKLKLTEEAVALMHGRAGDGPGAMMRNVTIARSSPAKGGYATGARDAIVQLNQYAADARAEIDGAVGRALGVLETLDPKLNRSTNPADVVAIKKAVQGALAKSFDGFRFDPPDVGATLAAAYKNNSNKMLKDRLRTDAHSEVSRLANAARALLDEVMSSIHRPLRAVGGVATSALSVLTALEMPESSDYYELPEERRLELEDALRDVRERLWDARDDVKADIDALSGQARFEIGKIAAAAGGDIRDGGDELQKQLVGVNQVLTDLLTGLQSSAGTVDQALADAVTAAKARLDTLGQELARERRKIDGGSNATALRALVTVCGAIESVLNTAVRTLEPLNVGDSIGPVGEVIEKGLNFIIPKGKALEAALDALLAGIAAGNGPLAELQQQANLMVTDAAKHLASAVDNLAELLTKPELMELIISGVIALSQDVENGDFTAWANDAINAIAPLAKGAATATTVVTREVEAAATTARAEIDRLEALAMAKVDAAVDVLFQAANAIENLLRSAAGDLTKSILSAFGLDQPGAIAQQIKNAAEAAIDSIAQGGERYLEEVKAAIYKEAAAATREIEERGRQLLGSIQSSVSEALGSDPAALADQALRLAQEGSDVLKLIRAVGDPPKNDRLGLNRPEIAYVLKEVDKIIDITPAISLVNRVSDTLAAIDQAGKAIGDLIPGMGFRLPTSSLAENMVPDALKGLSVSKLIPNIGGLDLRGLLVRAGFPDLDDLEAVKITQGFDKAERRLWMKAVIDVPFTAPVDILTFGPVTLAVDDARFFAESSMTTGLEGSKQRIAGRISGDWRVVCAGQDIITFRRTGLHFDESGKLDFKIAPERVELADVLELLTNFLAASGKGQGLVVEPLMRGSVPAGVAATLDLALPDLTLGAFAITNLSLHVMFGVAAIPEFELMGEVSVAQRTAPFTLSVWILNGGGYLTQRMSFRPTARPKPVLSYTLDVGIVAGVGLGFNFGVVSGGVWLQLGCSLAITWTTERGGNSTAVTVFILARGNVDVAGLVTANIMLLLEVSYDGARMIGRGTLRLSFKISMFFTLRVNQGVEYTFIGKKSTKPGADDYAGAYA